MYDFMLGTREEIVADPRRYLLSVKRMLPRWANSLPDSEFHALIDLVAYQDRDRPVFVETGVGASTLLFLHYAMARGGHVYSWDLNGSKASFIRSVAAETLEPHHGRPISDHWTFVSAMSLAPHTGLAAVCQLTDRIDMSMHDSDHTWDTITGEIDSLLPSLADGAIVCVDDANQIYVHTYEPIVNMTRKKAGLPPIEPLADNRDEPHYKRLPSFFEKRFERVEYPKHSFAQRLQEDPFYAWYSADREGMGKLGMERLEDLEGRFVAVQLSGRRDNK
ncbi:MAG: class I SAM-dependent methyltransferase [Rhodospirillaceae bacterium]|nr:class I SAM-dependent methyltransferase [Rhodospirillaceae bacterium]MDD9916016.1 class I SAM-dependent methyltransferase [Rhodospirillaceae bacterium]MDD9929659.1 class I SAM-dependent methyltransferase [Rhodospirillaceae bacterium]